MQIVDTSSPLARHHLSKDKPNGPLPVGVPKTPVAGVPPSRPATGGKAPRKSLPAKAKAKTGAAAKGPGSKIKKIKTKPLKGGSGLPGTAGEKRLQNQQR
jgi:hypothetical protein